MEKETKSSNNKIQPVEYIELDSKKQKENERENWSGKLDFFLSALSYSVGLGAVNSD